MTWKLSDKIVVLLCDWRSCRPYGAHTAIRYRFFLDLMYSDIEINLFCLQQCRVNHVIKLGIGLCCSVIR